MIEPSKLIQMYETGRITKMELGIRLLQMATERSPAEIGPNLTPDLIAELRDRVAVPPATPDHCRVISIVCATADFDSETHFRQESNRLFEGIWRWHAYFSESVP